MFQLIWYQLTNKGWSFRKPVDLSNDQRYVPPGEKLGQHCMQQGWFPEYLGLPPGVPPRMTTPSSTPHPETPSRPIPPRSTPPTTVLSQTALSATAEDPTQGPDAHLSVAAPSTPPAALKSATRTPKPAAKASKSPTKSKRRPAPLKRKEAPKPDFRSALSWRSANVFRKVVKLLFRVMLCVLRIVVNSQFRIQREATRARDPRFVTLDDFDSDDFLTALCRGRLLESLDSDDLNIGGDDWLLELDSEAEGDGDIILVDKDSSDSSDDEWTASPLNNYDEEGPVEFALRKPELDRLQVGGVGDIR
ncbi:hypothetical protein DVH05_012774 [Phytophthora capsici]|nr:hypothetical protein DVH05_012774 [Phytophthora capsici]